MKYKLMGRSGLRVSELCLGTMTFGEEWGWGGTKEESKKVFDSYVEAGGNFFDTANIYTKGTSESYLGEFIGTDREKCVIASKYTLSTNHSDPNAGGNQRKNLIQSVNASLKRLKTDYIDLLWIHAWDQHTPIDEMMRGLDDLVRQGKVLYIGASDTPAWVVSRANTMADYMGWTPFIAMQLEYSLVERTIEREYFWLAKHLDLAIAPWSPLGMGVLTGKYSKGQGEGRLDAMEPWKAQYFTEKNQKIVQVVVDIAKELGKSPAQIALNWMIQKSNGIIPIIGAKNRTQLIDNLGCVDFSLTSQQMTQLNDVSAISLGFPYEFLAREHVQEIMYGDTRDRVVSHRL